MFEILAYLYSYGTPHSKQFFKCQFKKRLGLTLLCQIEIVFSNNKKYFSHLKF